MKRVLIAGLVSASFLLVKQCCTAASASSVAAYNPGTGYAAGYTNANAAVGDPARVTPGIYGGPVTPFAPPYTSDQMVSVGANGSLTLQFNSPIRNDPNNPYGMDFLVFGGTGFIITNGNYTGGGITDGSKFGIGGPTRISVSQDGVNFYELNPSLAPVVDAGFPTDGSGDFSKPVNPALTLADFAGKDVEGIRALYNGSAGGTAYDLAWARDTSGQSVNINEVNFVRLDVLSGHTEIDGIAAVPEPTAWAFGILGTMLLYWRLKQSRV